MRAWQIVRGLLGADQCVRQMLGEASIHRPRRGRIYVASYTGPHGGQEWKSTGTADPTAALIIAQALEAAARAERLQADRTSRAPRIRNRQSPGGSGSGLTQRETALLLGLAERTVRAIEKRAIQKLWQHPQLREVWRQYLSGELTEQEHALSAAEIQALWGLARNRAEQSVLLKVLAIIQD